MKNYSKILYRIYLLALNLRLYLIFYAKKLQFNKNFLDNRLGI